MKYSYDRSYRDSLNKEVERIIKKLDDESKENNVSFFQKLIIKIKALLGFNGHS